MQLDVNGSISATNYFGDGSSLTNLSAQQVGLQYVDNTPDMYKPVSYATQVELNSKIQIGGDLTGSIISPTISNAAITTDKLANLSVTFEKIAENAVYSSNIAPGAINGSDIQIESITGSNIADHTISNYNLAPLSVGTGNIFPMSITSDKFAMQPGPIGEVMTSNGTEWVSQASSAVNLVSDQTISGYKTFTDGVIIDGSFESGGLIYPTSDGVNGQVLTTNGSGVIGWSTINTGGNTILNGAVNPDNTTGSNGDFYINTATSHIFGPKANGSWPTGISLIGMDGANGIDGLDGIDGVDGTNGIDGINGVDGILPSGTVGNIPYYDGIQWVTQYSPIQYNNDILLLSSGGINSSGNIHSDLSIDADGSIQAVGDITSSADIQGTNITAIGDVTAVNITATSNMDVSANLTVSGNLDVTNVTASGDISANNISSSVEINAYDITAAGDLSVLDIYASGDIQVSNVTATGNISAFDLTATGDLWVGNINATGDLYSVDINASGDIYTSGDLTVLDINSSGDLTVLDINSSGNLLVGDISAMGDLSVVNINAFGDLSAQDISASGQITSGNLTFPNTDGTNGQVLTTDGNGMISWSTIASGGNTILSGIIDPDNTIGSNGDFYINSVSSSIFGPKDNGSWPTGIQMIGTNGVDGMPGNDGYLSTSYTDGNIPYWDDLSSSWIINNSPVTLKYVTNQYELEVDGLISTSGNITASNFIGDGSQLTGLVLDSNSINSSHIIDGTIVGSDDLFFESVTHDKLAYESVTDYNIVNQAITADKIQDGAVTNAKLAMNSVTGNELADGSVSTSHILDNSITEYKLQNGSVSPDKILTSLNNLPSQGAVLTMGAFEFEWATIEMVDLSSDQNIEGEKSFEDNVRIGTTTATPSAALEVSSTVQGFLPPRMTASERNAIFSPAHGLIVFCTNCGTYGELQFWDGVGNWRNMAGGVGQN
jgi:hypothetical protein